MSVTHQRHMVCAVGAQRGREEERGKEACLPSHCPHPVPRRDFSQGV